MYTQEIEPLIKEWMENNANMRYALIIHHPDKKPFISYALDDCKDLLETYNIEDLSIIDNFSPQDIIAHEIEPGETGYIYELVDNDQVNLIAEYKKGRVK